jgi:catechol 2,3-dioxygenase-like lactoylglutathione lyase family enzyme
MAEDCLRAVLEDVQPVLMCREVAASIRFFERLGFALKFASDTDDPVYAGVARDGVEIHLQWQAASQWAHAIDRPTYRIRVQDVDGLYAEFRESGALAYGDATESPWRTPGDTGWGTREFHVRDPDGNGLQFYRVR